MKIYDLEYLFFRSLRRLRGRYLKARQRGSLSRRRILRVLGIAFVVGCVFTAQPAQTEMAYSAKEGRVKGQQVAAAEKVEKNEDAASSPSFSPPRPPSPFRIPDSPELGELTAKGVLFLDASSSAVLYGKDSRLPLPPASTTKIMTALVALKNFSLGEVVTVPGECLAVVGSKMGLRKGEKITVLNLLYGLLVSSASDAACSLSRHGGYSAEKFVAAMNGEAGRLGAANTHFTNTVGLDADGGGHVSSAADLLKITREALKDETFRRIVSTPKITVGSVDKIFWHPLATTNDLLGTLPGLSGVKTGWTEKARGCLVSLYRRGGHEVLGVVLGSEDRFGETQTILEWIFRVYRWPED